jgi:hypothetical protein
MRIVPEPCDDCSPCTGRGAQYALVECAQSTFVFNAVFVLRLWICASVLVEGRNLLPICHLRSPQLQFTHSLSFVPHKLNPHSLPLAPTHTYSRISHSRSRPYSHLLSSCTPGPIHTTSVCDDGDLSTEGDTCVGGVWYGVQCFPSLFVNPYLFFVFVLPL